MARGKGEGSIYKQADGLWAAAITLPPGPGGKQRRKVVRRKSKADAVKMMRTYQKQLREHGDLATSSVTLEAWMTHWLDDIASQQIRPKSLAGYRSVVTQHIIPELGKVRLERLTAQHVRQVHKRIMGTPKSRKLRGIAAQDLPPGTPMLSSTYALNAHNALSAALKVAHREGRIPINVCEMVDRPRTRVTEQKALDVRQAIQLLAHLSLRADGALWATYLLTGARRGEILGLEAERVTDQIDLSWQLQRIRDVSNVPADFEMRELGNGLYLTRPKSRAGWRIIPLVDPLKSILALHMAGRREGLVFLNGGRPWDPDAASSAWKVLLTEAGLPDDVVLHGSRHTTIDLLYEAGVPEAVIMEIVGHTTRAVTRGYKSRGNRKQLEDAMLKMSRLLEPGKS